MLSNRQKTKTTTKTTTKPNIALDSHSINTTNKCQIAEKTKHQKYEKHHIKSARDFLKKTKNKKQKTKQQQQQHHKKQKSLKYQIAVEKRKHFVVLFFIFFFHLLNLPIFNTLLNHGIK